MARRRADPNSLRAQAISKGLSACSHLGLTLLIMTILAIPALYLKSNGPIIYDYSYMEIDYSNPFKPQDVFQAYDSDFKYNILLDSHAHTDVGGGSLSPEMNIQWHIANGYNAVVITDHNDIERAFVAQQIAREKYADKIKVLVGQEYSNCRMHMCFLGLTKYVEVQKWPTDAQMQETINEVHRQGGLVVVNHKTWTYFAGLDMPSFDDLVKWGVDYFDVTTASLFDLQTYLYARKHGVGVVAATDIHEVNYANEWTLLNAANFSEEAILDALRSKNTSFIFDTIGHFPPVTQTLPRVNTAYTWAVPFLLLGDAIHTYYWREDPGAFSFVNIERCNEVGGKPHWLFDKQGIAVAFAWIFILWIMFEVSFTLIKIVALNAWSRVRAWRGHARARKYTDDDVFMETPLTDFESEWN